MEEVELKFAVPGRKIEEIRALINGGRLAGRVLRQPEEKVHTDTYFDSDGTLRDKGWSLRLREKGDDLRITLKFPRRSSVAEFGELVREEIENRDNNSLVEVFLDQIVPQLARAGIVAANPVGGRTDLLRNGILATLKNFGLKPVFTVSTERLKALLEDGQGVAAEASLDQSRYYTVDPSDSYSDAQLEIELAPGAARSVLEEVRFYLVHEKGLALTSVSKYQRGLDFYLATDLNEKLETKIILPSFDDYILVKDLLERDPRCIPGYEVAATPIPREIEDVYYDSRAFTLRNQNCYLRLRGEGGGRELTFRRLISGRSSEIARQEEIKIPAGELDEKVWRQLENRLSRIGVNLRSSTPGESLDVRLRGLGLNPVLQVHIHRTSWTLKRSLVDAERGVSPRQIAKIKFDRASFVSPLRAVQRKHDEFEVTGLEHSLESSGADDWAAYMTALAAFSDVCRMRVGRGTIQVVTGSKYATGLDLMRMVPENASQRHVIAVERDPAQGFEAGSSIRRLLLPLSLCISLSSTSTFLMTYFVNKNTRRSPVPLDLPIWSLAALAISIFIGASSLIFLRARSVVPSRIRVALVAFLGTVLLISFVGSAKAAELATIAGLPVAVLGLASISWQPDNARRR
ncbi:CYTH domain-containing protein [Frankia sp. Cpl3]|nr:CYTH domain-containing protein [Frankia sp. Cpl3]